MMKLGSWLYFTLRRSEKYINHVTHTLSFTELSIFSPGINNIYCIKKYRYRLHFNTSFLILLTFLSFSGCFDKHGCNFDDVSKISCSRPS